VRRIASPEFRLFEQSARWLRDICLNYRMATIAKWYCDRLNISGFDIGENNRFQGCCLMIM